MNLADVAAALMFLGVVAYAILGGADFGSGVWDLLAGDARDGAHLRSQIDRSIGPVWEANHVWLIFVLVFLWTGFPTAFGAIMTTLFVPWLLVGLGIVLRDDLEEWGRAQVLLASMLGDPDAVRAAGARQLELELLAVGTGQLTR